MEVRAMLMRCVWEVRIWLARRLVRLAMRLRGIPPDPPPGNVFWGPRCSWPIGRHSWLMLSYDQEEAWPARPASAV